MEVSRQQRRASYRSINKEIARQESGHKDAKVGPGRRAKWLQRHPKLAPFYTAAFGMLSTGDRAQKPAWKAVKKMMVVLATAPRVVLPGVGHVPYVLAQYRHKRSTWRSFPRHPITSNMGGALEHAI